LTIKVKTGMKKAYSRKNIRIPEKAGSEMKARYDSYCGLNCGACPIGLANETNNTDAIEQMAKDWEAEISDLKCSGCKTELTAIFCTSCAMRICAREKQLEFCYQCDEYPCEKITEFRNDKAPHHSAVFSNQENIKKKGLEPWLIAEKARWSCPDCGTRFSWYTDTCSKCNKELYNAVEEEKNLKR